MNQFMNVFRKWMKKEYPVLCSVLVMAFLLSICTYLFGESMRPLQVTLQVCGFCFLVWCILSLYFYRRKYRSLVRTQRELEHSIDSLPEARDATEVIYQEMLQELYGKCERLEQTLKARTTEEKDYYTLWVHQIKTPIAAMRLILQNMENQTRTAQLSRELFRIEQYAGMALQYIRLQDNGTDLNIRNCNVYEITKQVLKHFKTEFIEKKLSIQFEPFSCEMITDEKWLSFILEQILSNAVKYTEQGGITIECQEEDKAYTLLIRDTGIGIRPEDLPRIYDKGYTGYNGHMDKRSTGIGLYLCRKSADMLGIRLRTESAVHQGTATFLTLMKDCAEEM